MEYDWDAELAGGREVGEGLCLGGEDLLRFASAWASRGCCVHMLARGVASRGLLVTPRVREELLREIVEHEAVLYGYGLT